MVPLSSIASTRIILMEDPDISNTSITIMANEQKPFIYTRQYYVQRNNVKRVKVDPSVKEVCDNTFHDRTQIRTVHICKGLERVEEGEFTNCPSLGQIIIPSTVKVIGMRAFYECTQLRNVELPEQGELERIDEYAFAHCSSLERIVIPSSIKLIGESAFHECTQLKIVELCEGLEQIDDWAFANCSSLVSIIIPSSVKVIGEFAFSECTQLKIVELCEGLEQIDQYAFECCSSLVHISIPSTVKVVGRSAFYECTQLKVVEFCEGLEYIVSHSFSGCKSLQRIYIPSTIKSIGEFAFLLINDLVAIVFSEQIEHFVSEVLLREWWTDDRVPRRFLKKYFLLTRWNLPKRFGNLALTTGKMNIRGMLSRIPSVLSNELDFHMDLINSELVNYEQFQDCVTSILEPAIKIGADGIIPLIVSFL